VELERFVFLTYCGRHFCCHYKVSFFFSDIILVFFMMMIIAVIIIIIEIKGAWCFYASGRLVCSY
jgi:hypothetical protein